MCGCVFGCERVLVCLRGWSALAADRFNHTVHHWLRPKNPNYLPENGGLRNIALAHATRGAGTEGGGLARLLSMPYTIIVCSHQVQNIRNAKPLLLINKTGTGSVYKREILS